MQLEKVIEADKLSFSYNDLQILDNISFNIFKGDYLGLIGPNGGGKTTLLKLMLGLYKPVSGEIRLFGEKISNENLSRIGYVPQRMGAEIENFPASVEEIVMSGLTSKIGLFSKFNNQHKEKAYECMKKLEIEKYSKHLISKLSGGEKQRVFIARAMASDPEVLILDEPTVGVDQKAKENFEELLSGLNRKSITIILVTHDLDIIGERVKYVLCLNKNLVCHVTPREFFSGPYIEKAYGDVKFIKHKHD